MTGLHKELRDQTLHVAWCAAILLPVALWPGVPAFAWAGFGCGLIREITEEGAPVTPAKVWRAILVSKLDLTFWTVGGAFVGVLANLLETKHG